MSKKKKKRKNPNYRPPLTKLDKFLYVAFGFFGFVLLFALFIFIEARHQALGKANGAIAVEATMSIFTALIPSVPAIVGGMIFMYKGYEKRLPIFGPRTTKDKYKRKNPLSLAKLILITVAVVLWLFSFVFVVGASSSRVEITETHINTYAMFGKLEESRPVENAAEVRAEIYEKRGTSGKYSFNYGYSMSYVICFADGKEFTFVGSPAVMLELDELFAGVPKTVDGKEYFEEILRKYDLTPEEQEKLEKVFFIDD